MVRLSFFLNTCTWRMFFPTNILSATLVTLNFPSFIEDDDVVEVGAVAYEFILLQACSYESFLSVDVKFLVGFYHLGHLDGIEVAYFGFARMDLAVFAFEIFKPVDGHIGHVSKVVFNLSQFCLNLHQEVIRLILIIFKDSLHLDFEQFENIFAGDFPMESILSHSLAIHLGSKELILERLQFGVDECHYLILTLTLLKLALLVDALLDENAFERGEEEELFFQFALSDHQFLAEQSHGAVYAMLEHIADGEELWLVVFDDAAVGRNVDFAVAEGIEGIHRLV